MDARSLIAMKHFAPYTDVTHIKCLLPHLGLYSHWLWAIELCGTVSYAWTTQRKCMHAWYFSGSYAIYGSFRRSSLDPRTLCMIVSSLLAVGLLTQMNLLMLTMKVMAMV